MHKCRRLLFHSGRMDSRGLIASTTTNSSTHFEASFKHLLGATTAFFTLSKKQVRVHKRGLAETTSFITHFSRSHRLHSVKHTGQDRHLRWVVSNNFGAWLADRTGPHLEAENLYGLAAVCQLLWVTALKCSLNLIPEEFIAGQPQLGQ